MPQILNHPAVFGLGATLLLLAASYIGSALRVRHLVLVEQNESSLKALEGAILGLLALLVGFTFSMGIARYDMHIQMEIDEANAIGTVLLRADTLPALQQAAVQQLIREYVPVRLRFTSAATDADTQRVTADSTALQSQLWSLAQMQAHTERDPVTALFVASVNDLIDTSEKRSAALENRIPTLAWQMLLFVGCVGSLFVGMTITSRSRLLMATLPIVLGVVLTLILDLDSPHAGFIQINQQSMQRLAAEVR